MSHEREQLELRALEPVAQCLIRRLLVPKVYFEVRTSDGTRVDVLLVNRAGTSDIHVVEVRSFMDQGLEALSHLFDVPAHFRWLAVPLSDEERQSVFLQREQFYPPSGAGRIGLIEVVRMAGDDLGANVIFKAERFHGQHWLGLEEVIGSRSPDIQFG